MRWFARTRETLILLLLLLLAALALANLVRHGLLTTSKLQQSKDALAALQSAVQVIFIILGAIFSYYRFFRGRTFVSRAELAVSVRVIAMGNDRNLHWVEIELKNLGTVSIWDPRPVMTVQEFGQSRVSRRTLEQWREASGDNVTRKTFTVVDSGETVTFTMDHEVPKAVWAVGYEVFLTDADGTTWKRSSLVANQESPGSESLPAQ